MIALPHPSPPKQNYIRNEPFHGCLRGEGESSSVHWLNSGSPAIPAFSSSLLFIENSEELLILIPLLRLRKLRFRLQVQLEPTRRESRDFLQRSRFLKQMGRVR